MTMLAKRGLESVGHLLLDAGIEDGSVGEDRRERPAVYDDERAGPPVRFLAGESEEPIAVAAQVHSEHHRA
ncbi:hypothetical protein VR46_35585, partial [Streptomyces sp. NRRL S-444]